MKKAIITAVLVFCMLGAVSAENRNKSFIGLDVFGGGTFEFGNNINTDNVVNAMGTFLTSFRVGGGADLNFRILDPLSVGVEAGLFVFATTGTDGTTSFAPLVDIPVRATVRFSLGKTIALQVHGGYNFATTFNALAETTNYLDIDHKFDLGGRVYLGAFYLEYSRLFWTASSTSLAAGSNRVGLGLSISLF